jgi:hypothetical protein
LTLLPLREILEERRSTIYIETFLKRLPPIVREILNRVNLTILTKTFKTSKE